jgi:hypothetical protein
MQTAPSLSAMRMGSGVRSQKRAATRPAPRPARPIRIHSSLASRIRTLERSTYMPSRFAIGAAISAGSMRR